MAECSKEIALLAIETATEACSAALYVNGSSKQYYELAPRQHTQLILEMVDNLLVDNNISLHQLNGIAYGCGPGSFTGVRIATSIAQGLAFGASLSVIPISTLAALAQSMISKHQYIISAIDARMQEVYWGCFQKNEPGSLGAACDEQISPPEAVQPVGNHNDYCAIGPAWGKYVDCFKQRLTGRLAAIYPNDYPQAKHILTLALPVFLRAGAINPKIATPCYLREQITQKSK